MNLDRLLAVAMEAVDLAADLIGTRQPGHLTPKGHRDYASEVDFAIERSLRTLLAARTPSIGFLGEESGRSGSADGLHWVLDPIDGTINYTHRLPLCGVSLALVGDHIPVLGVVDQPFLSSRYHATTGGGVFGNGAPIHVGNVDQLPDAIVSIGDYAVGDGADDKNRQRLQLTTALASRVLRVRMFGSAVIDLTWLADGRTDASVALSNRPWDMAAGVIIAREAGAWVFDIDGSDYTLASTCTIATNPGLRTMLLDLLAGLSGQ